ncbi:Serine/threonine-protein phosphatase 2A activator [Tritrichomonas foetus]|uniref:Serine/threonine-protein phosphatase 2A activator n=1 Tax=Tritrichomonas foetus TaxID=1144522 RepID=A0A1J4JW76_9EUKA|nr:Serine/threonine-protein phosphatase 2A activator [Tritrichomonas foetus]|eukprot:OHT01780.1 Serine/threonine-protein phosphatase 2A activator [Tritrichomonas foetus]
MQLERKINTDNDLIKWKKSPAHQKIENVLISLDSAIKSKPRKINSHPSVGITKILDVLNITQQYIVDTPKEEQSSCFSNHGFVNFIHKISEDRHKIFNNLTQNEEAIEYFLISFGNSIRVDLGTGNEMNFLAFICCLFELNILSQNVTDYEDVVFLVFWKYWDLLISIQRKFRLVPAGTHGSWGVDDFVCLPFLFGSSQLIQNQKSITPLNVIEKETSLLYKDEFSYCKWIEYLYESKSGPFSQHSRILYSLSRIPDFEQIHQGMMKMFHAEVLNKFVVVQQFGFGTILQWNEDDRK